jgi:rod shape-determining protein MreC
MNKKRILYFSLISLFVLLMLFQPTRSIVRRMASDFFYPFLSLIQKVENVVASQGLARKSKNVLIAELYELEKTNSKLSAKCEQLDVLINENNELRKILDLKAHPDYRYIFAEIIYRDPVEWFNRFAVNKGENDGIENGAVVLARINTGDSRKESKFGVVGRISTLSNHTSSVSTIISDECKLSVLIPENGAKGVIVGGKRDGRKFWTKISYLPRDLVYKQSSPVFTSGMNTLTPADLAVGSIMGKNSADVRVYNNLFVEAKLKPAVDLNHLKFVLILVKKK